MIVVFEGTQEEYWQRLSEVVDQRIQARESQRAKPLSKSEACEQLGITYRTLMKVMDELSLTDIYPSDVQRILVRYPKYIKKAKVA